MREIEIPGEWTERLQDIIGRRRDLWVVLAIVGVAVVAVGMVAMRPAPKVAPPNTIDKPVTPPTPVASLMVHVAGAVVSPGLYQFPDGARVADAIAAAGGPVRRADLDALNLAESLRDGMKIEVPLVGSPITSVTPASSPNPAVVDLNSADQAALETIPGVGPVTAMAIIAVRDAAGGFDSLEQLLDVDGIGPATLEAIRPYVTV